MRVRKATLDDALDVRRLLDAAMLEPGDVDVRIRANDVLVAVDEGGTAASSERPLGTIVLEPRDAGAYVAGIAVRRRHRARGIGSRLMRTALEREGRLTAQFDGRVRPFYESLAFSIEPIDDGRYRGVRTRG